MCIRDSICCVHVVDELLGLDEWIWCLQPCESVSFEVTYTVPLDWNYCDDGEWLYNFVYAYGCGCYEWAWLDNPFVYDYDEWWVFIPTYCCPYECNNCVD